MLLALAKELDCDAVDGGIVGDDERAITDAVERAVETCDVLLTSGAVSVGDYDFVKLVLDRIARERGGVSLWAQVAIKPAKPLAFAMLGAVPAFGLPGNPVSSRVSFELFARPALRKLAGRSDVAAVPVRAVTAEPLRRRPDGKLHLDRVRVWLEDGAYRCERAGRRRATCWPRPRVPTVWCCSTTARVWTRGPRCGCSCSEVPFGPGVTWVTARPVFGARPLANATDRGTTCT